MRPSNSKYRFFGSTTADAVLSAYRSIAGISRLFPAAHINNHSGGQCGLSVTLTSSKAVRWHRFSSASAVSVLTVLAMSVRSKMIRIHARRIVAAMTNLKSLWDRAVMYLIAKAVCQYKAFVFLSTFADNAVALVVSRTYPRPAGIGIIGLSNVFPKANFYGLNSKRMPAARATESREPLADSFRGSKEILVTVFAGTLNLWYTWSGHVGLRSYRNPAWLGLGRGSSLFSSRFNYILPTALIQDCV